MSSFHYVAVDQSGREQTGVLEAETEKQARQLLRDRSLVPLRLRSTRTKKTDTTNNKLSSLRFLGSRGLNAKELALITRQFATLLTAGLPLEEALHAVAEQTERPNTKGIMLSVRSKVLEGYALAAALREHPEAFSSLYCATIAAGEKSGHLDKVLLRLADYTEQQWHMRQKLKTALIYPSMIILVAFGIVGFLLAYVVPKMVGVYAHLNQALPMLTQVLLAISHFVQTYGLFLLAGTVVGIIFWRRLLKRNALLREATHRVLLRSGLIGHAIKIADTARFARTFAILSSSGVSVLEAMTISAELMTTIPIQKAVTAAVLRVREGATIHLALKQTTYFPPMSIHMLASGEASGQLEPMLERVAHHQEDEITRLIDVGLALFEPAIILVMGAIVLFIVLAIMLPIFQLNEFAN